jgi:methionine aminopeptidase
VLAAVVKEVQPGKKIVDICTLGDKLINDAISAVYKGKDVEKGVAFPTSLSVNNCLGHFSPLAGDATTLADDQFIYVDSRLILFQRPWCSH